MVMNMKFESLKKDVSKMMSFKMNTFCLFVKTQVWKCSSLYINVLLLKVLVEMATIEKKSLCC